MDETSRHHYRGKEPRYAPRYETFFVSQSHLSPRSTSATIHYFESFTMDTVPQVDPSELNQVFHFCRSDQWKNVHDLVVEKPWIALTPMIMDNRITTTILHQAITSKGEIGHRAVVIEAILARTPKAAELKNGYASLPLHVIAQRNTKIDAQTKERLTFKLIEAYEKALVEQGGPGKRTPLHIVFTGECLVSPNSCYHSKDFF